MRIPFIILREIHMNIVATIVPIFIVISLGWLAFHKGYMPKAFCDAANQLVYYLAIPAMIFRAIAKASFKHQFNPTVVVIALAVIFIAFLLSIFTARFFRIKENRIGSFAQCSYHGNLGYVGLAVAYYYMGDEGFVKASILTGFIVIFQNILSVVVLNLFSDTGRSGLMKMAVRIMGNPVIIASIAGIFFSVSEIHIHVIIERTLDIIKGMALPLALLIIGSSLSFDLIKDKVKPVFYASIIKLLILPAFGFCLFKMLHINAADYLPALILLSSPAATVAFIMAKQMNGDTDFAVAAVSGSTLFSSITFFLWLHMA